jgi:hypothetical protein
VVVSECGFVFCSLSSWSIFGGLTSVFLVNFGSVCSLICGLQFGGTPIMV